MEFKVRINTNNAAFKDDPNEINRILQFITDKIEAEGIHDFHVKDINGNKVGYVSVLEG